MATLWRCCSRSWPAERRLFRWLLFIRWSVVVHSLLTVDSVGRHQVALEKSTICNELIDWLIDCTIDWLSRCASHSVSSRTIHTPFGTQLDICNVTWRNAESRIFTQTRLISQFSTLNSWRGMSVSSWSVELYSKGPKHAQALWCKHYSLPRFCIREYSSCS